MKRTVPPSEKQSEFKRYTGVSFLTTVIVLSELLAISRGSQVNVEDINSIVGYFLFIIVFLITTAVKNRKKEFIGFLDQLECPKTLKILSFVLFSSYCISIFILGLPVFHHHSIEIVSHIVFWYIVLGVLLLAWFILFNMNHLKSIDRSIFDSVVDFLYFGIGCIIVMVPPFLVISIYTNIHDFIYAQVVKSLPIYWGIFLINVPMIFWFLYSATISLTLIVANLPSKRNP